jgi:hypothetical protein
MEHFVLYVIAWVGIFYFISLLGFARLVREGMDVHNCVF